MNIIQQCNLYLLKVQQYHQHVILSNNTMVEKTIFDLKNRLAFINSRPLAEQYVLLLTLQSKLKYLLPSPQSSDYCVYKQQFDELFNECKSLIIARTRSILKNKLTC